jgi:glycosyltransferase involved in cell wall biosynthesis
MANDLPKVSIGMPVYNGERYLRQALDSLLKQDFTDFELIISDNASTDSTQEICQEYSARDGRIRYYRNKENIGAVKNFNRLFELASGQYFMWAAADDLWADTFISECIKGLETTPAAVLCCTRLEFIDLNGNPIEFDFPKDPNFDSLGLVTRQRIRLLLSQVGWYAIYGLIRPEALKQTRLCSSQWGHDVILLLELCLLGEFVRIPQTLFYYRRLDKDVANVMAAIDPAQGSTELVTPFTNLVTDLIKAAWRFDKGNYRKAVVIFEISYTCLYRNHIFRRLVSEENLVKFRRSWKSKDFVSMFYAIVTLVLSLPGTIKLLKDKNSQRLLTAYRKRNFLGALFHMPVYLLLNCSNLFRLEAWQSLGKLGKNALSKNTARFK